MIADASSVIYVDTTVHVSIAEGDVGVVPHQSSNSGGMKMRLIVDK